ncbi:MAG TPA: DUF1566 domain-containing protein [Candidatus Binataceae bacterium]|nr:DUF1566 domain-containing protein [Candidatus Binataceae bacterium]
MSLPLTLVALTLLWAGAAAAQPGYFEPDPALACQQNKLVAQEALANCLERNAAQLLTGAAGQATQCMNRFSAALKQIDGIAAREGTSCRYVDNGDGTVYDWNHGLTWEKKTGTVGEQADPSDPHNVNNTYTWSSNSSGDPNGTVFTSFLSMLNDSTSSGGCFANHCDWRLPSVEELIGLINPPCGTRLPCIDPIFGPTRSSNYWSDTTPPVPVPGFVWAVDFQDGTQGIFLKNGPLFYVRAVRTGF